MSPTREIEEATANPTKRYDSPTEVVEDSSIDAAIRLAILKSWEKEARDLQRASDENMMGGEPSLLPEVRRAIDRLCREHDLSEDEVAETKKTSGQAAGPQPRGCQ